MSGKPKSCLRKRIVEQGILLAGPAERTEMLTTAFATRLMIGASVGGFCASKIAAAVRRDKQETRPPTAEGACRNGKSGDAAHRAYVPSNAGMKTKNAKTQNAVTATLPTASLAQVQAPICRLLRSFKE
jgi:hypothetical protein